METKVCNIQDPYPYFDSRHDKDADMGGKSEGIVGYLDLDSINT